MAEFFHMGGYAFYVWTSYAMAIIVLWLNWYLPRKQHSRLLRQLKRRGKAEAE